MKQQKIRVIVDGTIDYIKGTKKEDLVIADVHLFKNEKEVQMSKKEFYKQISDKGVIFKTSQGTPQDFKKAYDKCSNNKVIVITVSSKLSGTYNSALIAKKQSDNHENITVIDSLTTSAGIGILAKTAVESIQRGDSYREVIRKVKSLIPEIKIYLIVNSLEYLVKGGRVNKAIGFVGGLVKLKPVLELTNGELKSAGKMLLFNDLVKGFYNFVVGKISNAQKVYLLHNDLVKEKSELKALLEKNYEVEVLNSVNPVLGVHLGPEALVIGWVEK